MEIRFSLECIRKIFHIHPRKKIFWCVLVEKFPEGERYRLGVGLAHSNKAIEVGARRFVQLNGSALVSYHAYPAKKSKKDGMYTFRSCGGCVEVPETYISDVYYRSIYSEDMMDMPLL